MRGSPRSNVSTWPSSGSSREVEADHVLDVGVRELVVADPGPEAVDHADAAGAQRGRQQRADLGVDLVGIRPAVDAVDLLAVVHEAIAAQLEVGRRHERQPERAGDPVVLPVGGVVRPVGDHDHAAVAEHAAQRCGDAVERHGTRGHVEPAQHGVARGDPVGDPARRAHVVLEHEPFAVAPAHEVEAGDADPDAVPRAHARHRRLDVLGAVEHALRQHALGDDQPVRVDVGDERVEGFHALREAGRDGLPLGARDHARDRVDVPVLVAVDRLEGDAERGDLLAHPGGERREVLGEHRVHDLACGGADAPVRRHGVVEGCRVVAGERVHARRPTQTPSRADAPEWSHAERRRPAPRRARDGA